MTTVLERTGQSGPADGTDAASGGTGPSRASGSWFARDPAWPIVAVLAGWPIWWALGIGSQIFILAAIPMIRRMYRARMKSGRSIRVPPGFGIWVLFLIVMIGGIITISVAAPETIQSSVGNRILAYADRTLSYGGATVILLYAGNLTERELSRRRLAWLLGLVGIYSTIGGLAGVVDPHFGFTSPLAHLLPASLQSALATSLNPGTSQVMGFLGFAEGRVKAPFTYTNQWGNCIAILLPWLIVAWYCYGKRWQKRATVFILAITVIPLVFSLDRGLWVGLLVSLLYLAVRFALQGKLAMLGIFCGILALAAIVIVASPLGSLVSQRLAHGKSNTIRASVSLIALNDAEASPLIGYGDTRHMQGSTQSIAIGSTSSCKKCGNTTVGGNGQLQLMLICNGFLGAALYVAFFAYVFWRYRRDRTPYGMTGLLVLLLGFIFMPVYEAIGPPMAFTMLAVALLWKNDRELRPENAAPAETASAQVPPVIEQRGAMREITA